MRVVVVGAGVVGLSCAVRLAEAGLEPHVLARDLPLETTSAVAAALWYPYRASPPDRVLGWATATYDELARLAREHPGCGVRMLAGGELLAGPPAEGAPWWRAAVPALEVRGDPRPAYRFEAPVVDMATYLPWLVARLGSLGGTVTRHWLPELPDRGLVVNCSGLGSRRLAHDPDVAPVRGQVVHVRPRDAAPDWRHEWVLDSRDEAALTYAVPREDVLVVGGTAEEGRWDPTPDPATTRAILDRAATLLPAVRDAEVVGVRVGLRPARPSVRLESENRGGACVVHCYGHGGAGVTLSWACADEVRRLVQEAAGGG